MSDPRGPLYVDDMSPDSRFPELPSDEELGIDGLDLSDFDDDPPAPEGTAPPPAQDPPAAAPPAPPPAAEPPPPPPPVVGPPPGGGGWAAALVTLLILLGGAWGSSAFRMLPDPVAANAPAGEFSSARAMTNLVELARAPRPLGSPEHTRAREWVIRQLGELGIEADIHESLFTRATPSELQSFLLRNVVARIPGTDPSGALLLMAHYDGVPHTPAAGDDGVGVVVIIEALRALLVEGPPTNDLIILITDGEELGLLGARAFAAEHPWMDDVSLVINLEMRGGGGPVILFETGRDNGWVVEATRRVDPSPLTPSFVTAVYRTMPNDTDFSIFRDAGIQGVNLAGAADAWVYHLPTDSPENISEATLQHMGDRALALTREFAHTDLSVTHAEDRASLHLPLVGLVTWPAGWSPLAGALLLLIWASLALFVVMRGPGRGWLPLGMGVLGSILLVGAAAGAGQLLLRQLRPFHPEVGFLVGQTLYGEGWYALALAAVTLALAVALAAYRPVEGRLPLHVGVAFLPVGVASGLAFTSPLAAAPFLVGAAGLLLALLLRGIIPTGARGSAVGGWGALVLVLAPSLLVMAALFPVVEVLVLALGFSLPAALGVGMALLLLALFPALEPLTWPTRWWAPSTALVTGALLVVGGLRFGGAGEERPLPSTLTHMHSHPTGEGWLVTLDDSGYPWAEERFGSFAAEESVPVLDHLSRVRRWGRGEFLTRSLPVGLEREHPIPQVELLSPGDTAAPGEPEETTVRLRIRSEVGAERVHLLAQEGIFEFAALEGRPLALRDGGAVTRLVHQGPAGESFEVTLRLRAGRSPEVPIVLEILEEHLRPGELLGEEVFRRPPGLMAATYSGSDRSLFHSLHPIPGGNVVPTEVPTGVAPYPGIVDDSSAPEGEPPPPAPGDL